MDDLLTSYISLVLANINKKQPGATQRLSTAGVAGGAAGARR